MLRPPENNRSLTQDRFEDLLNWLNSDRDTAGMEYEDMRQRLIKLFSCRRCHDPEFLADETMNRVAVKIKQIRDTFVGPREPYFYAVANKIHLEYLRVKPTVQIPPGLPSKTSSDAIEAEYDCLERCLDHQPPEQRKMVLEYYKGERRTKIDSRKDLAEQYGIPLNALRIRVHRIRGRLEVCVKNCIDATAGNQLDH